MSKRTATAYLILKAKRSQWGRLDENGLEITVRVSVELDDAAFSPVTADLALSIDPANLIRAVLTDIAPEPEVQS